MKLQLKKTSSSPESTPTIVKDSALFCGLEKKQLCKKTKNAHINRTRREETRNIKKMTWKRLESIVKCVQDREEMWWEISKNEKGST